MELRRRYLHLTPITRVRQQALVKMYGTAYGTFVQMIIPIYMVIIFVHRESLEVHTYCVVHYNVWWNVSNRIQIVIYFDVS